MKQFKSFRNLSSLAIMLIATPFLAACSGNDNDDNKPSNQFGNAEGHSVPRYPLQPLPNPLQPLPSPLLKERGNSLSPALSRGRGSYSP